MHRTLIALLVFAFTAFSQQDTGMITGQVIDHTGAVIPGAAVQVTNKDTNTGIKVSTGADGIYVATPLRIGVYSVSVEAKGFKRALQDEIELRVQDRLRVDFRLELGEITQTVEVVAAAPLLQSETTSLGQVMETRKVVELPLNGRNFIQLIALATGAYVPQSNNSLYQNFLIGINGNRIQNNNFLLDGVNNNTTDNNNAPVLPSPDAIAEFKVQSNLLPAEFGRGLGGTINVNLKSGTNQFHGTAFEFLRNSEMDANAFFNSGRAKPPFQQNQFGFAMGGPVEIPRIYNGKDRTFFFGDYQGTRIRKGLTRIFTVPSAALRAGDFSGGPTIYDPLTTRPNPSGSGFVRDPIAGNRISADRLDPIMQRYLALFPLPNRPGTGNNFVLNPKFTDNSDQGDIKVDHTFSSRDSMFVRGSVSDDTFVVPLNVPGVPFNGYFSDNSYLPQVINARGLAISETHLFSPRIANEFRLGYNRLFATVTPRSGGRNLSTDFGIPGVPDDRQGNGLATVGITGFSSLGDSFDTRRGQNVYQVLDNISIVAGRHAFKAGFDHRRTGFNLNQGSSPRGNFSYSGVFSNVPQTPADANNAFADFLMGYPNSSNIGNLVHMGIRIRNYSAFLQDDWKLTPRLTMNIGVRYEYTTPVTEVGNRMANFDIATNSVIVAKAGSLRDRALANPDRNNFAPRFGIAWQITPRTVIRTGYGIFYTLEDAGHHNPTFNPPFQANLNFPSDQLNPGTSRRPGQGFPVISLGSNFSNLFLGVNGRPFDFPAAYSQQWNFTVERQLGSILLEAAYVGNKANKLMANRNINQPMPGPGSVNSRRLFPGWGTITFQEPRGNSNYHALQMKAEKRFSRGLTFLVSYTFAKAIDDSDSTQLSTTAGTGNLQSQFDFRAERSRSFQDVRNRLVASYIYELPFGAGKPLLSGIGSHWNRLVGGWQINGITTLQSGRAFTVNSPFDQSNTGSSNIRPDATGVSPELPKDKRTVERFFDPAAYRLPNGFAFGNAGRNTGTGPGQVNFDFALFKNIAIDAESRRTLQFRAEFFNVMNTPQFQIPGRTFGTPQFATITSTVNDNRDIQLGLKLIW